MYNITNELKRKKIRKWSLLNFPPFLQKSKRPKKCGKFNFLTFLCFLVGFIFTSKLNKYLVQCLFHVLTLSLMIMHAKCQKDNYSSSLTKRFIYFHHVVLLFLLNYGINCTSVFVCINSVADSAEVRHIYRNTSFGRLLMTSLGNFPFP